MKAVLVTGASRGIGRALAERFAKNQEYIVFAASRTLPESAAASFHEKGIWHIPCDLSEPASIDALFQTIYEKVPSLSILINNAAEAYFGLLQDTPLEDFDRLIALNLRAPFLCCKKALPPMIQKKEGVILNISSIWGEVGASLETLYSATKGGLNALTRALAKETAPSRVRVNALSLGAVDTAMNDHLTEEERLLLTEQIGLGRMATAEECAAFAYHLCTDDSAYLTGQVIRLDGGFC